MSFRRLGHRAVALVLITALAQAATGFVFLADAWASDHHADRSDHDHDHGSAHGHAVSVVARGGHRYLVLSHGESSNPAAAVDPLGGRPAYAATERDHAYRLADVESTGATPIRLALDPVPIPAIALAVPGGAVSPSRAATSPNPHPSFPRHLKSTVLRL